MAEEDHFIIVKGEVGSEECGLAWADDRSVLNCRRWWWRVASRMEMRKMSVSL